MAILQVNFVSRCLSRTVPIQVILPVDKLTADGKLPAAKKFKTLYLLHGYLGNYTDWVSGTRIQRWAEERDLAVVMPSGDNAFYVDYPATGNNYGEFIGKELVEITRRMFPLSHKREDTFIGGLSMGGFGAVRNGLKYHKTFGAVISLSGAFHVAQDGREEDMKKRFGCDGEIDPVALAEKLAKKGAEKPKIYITCGTEDGLLPSSQKYAAQLRELGYDVTYDEGPGGHDWDFWDTHIKKVVDWLPLDDLSRGINSGNVKV